MTAWGIDSLVHTSPTIRTRETAEIVADRKRDDCAGILRAIVPQFQSLETAAAF